MPGAGDHPRSRGVYRVLPARASTARGSSPLARGLRIRNGEDPERIGIIPARAGFTSTRPPDSSTPADHPRSRGVYAGGDLGIGCGLGSSPLARGLRAGYRHRRRGRGIIPARAGFTHPSRASGRRSRDHPRSRGVYGGDVGRDGYRGGSSPLARGLPPSRPPGRRGGGIIPARAGFTCRRLPPPRGRSDHPRSRGVYRFSWGFIMLSGGSSPLARGLPATAALGRGVLGIIPARAGFTLNANGMDGFASGSSPLARGLPATAALGRGVLGIIPARAGFTLNANGMDGFASGSSPLARGLRTPRRGSTGRARDHPRSRGVYRWRSHGLGRRMGSSPLARGLLSGLMWIIIKTGIIPARAGFTYDHDFRPRRA